MLSAYFYDAKTFKDLVDLVHGNLNSSEKKVVDWTYVSVTERVVVRRKDCGRFVVFVRDLAR